MKGKIYIHKNKINNKCYVGQTTMKRIHDRWRTNGVGYIGSPKFYNAIEKYGWNNFEHIVLPAIYTTQEELDQAEIDMIKELNSIENGYNSMTGGKSGYTVTDEHRENISEETKEKLRQANLKLIKERYMIKRIE